MAVRDSIVTKTLLCIDKVENYEITGRIYNPYIKECIPFSSSKQILDIMQGFFDRIAFPQACFTTRSFEEKKKEPCCKPAPELVRYFEDSIFTDHRGEIVSLFLTVRFRRQAEWQGALVCAEDGRDDSFGSTVDLFRILEQIVEQATGISFTKEWNGG